MTTPANLIGDRVLFLGAHADDIEIGCAGTAAKLAAAGRAIAFAQAADCGPARRKEATTAAALLHLSVAEGNLSFGLIPDGRLEERKDVLRNWLVDLAERFEPDTVFVHRGDDSHPDHVALYEGAIRVFVNHTVLLYPIPKLAAQATAFQPNYYEDISAFMETELQLCACHGSQASKGIYLDPEHLRSLARVAYQSGFNRTGGFAEPFRIHVARSASERPSATEPSSHTSLPRPAAPTPQAPPRAVGTRTVPPADSASAKPRPRKPAAKSGGVTMNIGSVRGQVIGKQIIKGDQTNIFG
jgi:LmbE family N-acetylglucosaminyl deacetylase